MTEKEKKMTEKDLTNMSDVDVLRLIAKDFGIDFDYDIKIVDEKKGEEKLFKNLKIGSELCVKCLQSVVNMVLER